jgi:predicted AAA+ superfamily ATPase
MDEFIPRVLSKRIIQQMKPNKVVLIFGSRRVGKTWLIKHLARTQMKEPYLLLNGEDLLVQETLSMRTAENYRRLLGDNKILILDEAQKVPQVGQVLKFIVDEIPAVKVIATGSSAFDLANKMGEPLTGRKTTNILFPIAQMELSSMENMIETKARLEERMVFGSYPEIITMKVTNEKIAWLKELVSSYLLKDIFEFDGIRNSAKILALLKLVAFQTGKEVSLEELARQLGISRNTVEKYLDLLTQVFILFRVPGFSRNLRTEVTKTSRWYFYDNGVRNAIIMNFNPLTLRDDTGLLWENYLLSERIKKQHYSGMHCENYFWRTYQQQEIDWIEERDGRLFGYELKWNPQKKTREPLTWKRAYPESNFEVISRDNYLDWIC